MTHTITKNYLKSTLLIWVIVMSHEKCVSKTGVWNTVFPYFCVGGAIKFQKNNVSEFQILFALKWYAYCVYWISRKWVITDVLKIEHP